MIYFDSLEWQERFLHNSSRVLSGMAYGKYCDKGRGMIVIELRRCWDQEKKGMWWASLGLIKPLEGIIETIEMVETYNPLKEYLVSIEPFEVELGATTYLRYLLLSH